MKTSLPVRWRWSRDRFGCGIDLTSWLFGVVYCHGSLGVMCGPLWFDYDFSKRAQR